MRWLLIPIFALAVIGCDKPEYEQCRQLCWKYNELHYWESFDKETADLSPADKAKARAEREELWNEMKNAEENRSLDNCVTACRQSGKRSDVACVLRAETAEQARACKINER